MSKLNAELLAQSVDDLLAYSKGESIKVAGKEVKGKVRKFTETIELQVSHDDDVCWMDGWMDGWIEVRRLYMHGKVGR